MNKRGARRRDRNCGGCVTAAAAQPPPDDSQAFTTRRRDPAGKREAVLRAAAQLVLEKGYRRASMNDLAERLKVTKPALYHYFRNKEEILFECFRQGTGLIENGTNDVAARSETGLRKVQAFIYSYASVMTVGLARCVMRLNEADLSPGAQAQIRGYVKMLDRRLRGLIQEGIEDGSVVECDPKIAAFAIVGALNWISRWYRPEGPLPAEEIARQFARTLTRGLAARKRGGARLVKRQEAK